MTQADWPSTPQGLATLTERLPSRTLARFLREHPAEQRGRRAWRGLMTVLIIAAALVSGGFFLLLLALPSDHKERFVLGLVLVIMLTAAAFRALRRSEERDLERQYRLTAFAETNGLAFVRRSNEPLPGALFAIGEHQAQGDALRSRSGNVKVGTLTARWSGSQGSPDRTFGYVAVRTGIRHPHMVLNAAGASAVFLTVSDVPSELVPVGVADATGGTLYAEPGAEALARTVFTPEFLSRLGGEVSVEFVDGWAICSSTHAMITLHPDVWRWVFALAAAVQVQLAASGLAPRKAAGDSPTPPLTLLTPPPALRAARAKQQRALRAGTVLFWGAVIAVGVFVLIPR